jgi:hypothetical protein
VIFDDNNSHAGDPNSGARPAQAHFAVTDEHSAGAERFHAIRVLPRG